MALLLLTLLAGAGPAQASLGGITLESGKTKPPSDHDGDADSDPAATTEDTDSNDGTADGQGDEGDNAHPSGNDRSVENGGSGTQGNAESNPDDSRGPEHFEGNPGDDKADGAGGTDLADQDGNNGCGNDDDFADDNNGHCGAPAAHPNPISCGESSGTGHGWECSEQASGSNANPPKDEAGSASIGREENDEPHGQGPDGKTEVDIANGQGDTSGSTTPATVETHVDQAEPRPVVEKDEDAGDSGCSDRGMADGSSNCGSAPDSVLGAALRQGAATVHGAAKALGTVLPFTGAADLLLFLALAVVLIACGILASRKRSSES